MHFYINHLMRIWSWTNHLKYICFRNAQGKNCQSLGEKRVNNPSQEIKGSLELAQKMSRKNENKNMIPKRLYLVWPKHSNVLSFSKSRSPPPNKPPIRALPTAANSHRWPWRSDACAGASLRAVAGCGGSPEGEICCLCSAAVSITFPSETAKKKRQKRKKKKNKWRNKPYSSSTPWSNKCVFPIWGTPTC